jgi:hypothetical protein
VKNWQWGVLGIFLATGGFYGWNMIRGLRNHNPGNLRRSNDEWQGLRVIQTDSAFFQFTEPKWGIRAMARVLLNYQNLYGLRSVEQIINRWAPSNENDTQSYIDSVADKLGVHPWANISVQRNLSELITAIIVHENGMNPYREVTINEAIALV